MEGSFKDLFEQMTEKDPELRISIQQVKEHEFYKDLQNEKKKLQK